MKLKACERCGKRTAEGLTLCPDCMKESGAAATAKSAKCPAYYTPETDGLNSPWNLAGGVLFGVTLHTDGKPGNGFAKPMRNPGAGQRLSC